MNRFNRGPAGGSATRKDLDGCFYEAARARATLASKSAMLECRSSRSSMNHFSAAYSSGAAAIRRGFAGVFAQGDRRLAPPDTPERPYETRWGLRQKLDLDPLVSGSSLRKRTKAPAWASGGTLRLRAFFVRRDQSGALLLQTKNDPLGGDLGHHAIVRASGVSGEAQGFGDL